MRAFLALLLTLSASAWAASVAVAPSSSGDGSGSDWNNRAQWSTVSLARGNTYYLMEGTYGAKSLSTAASGTTLITIKKCTAGEGTCTALAGWSDALGDAEAIFTGALTVSTSYWTIDGTTGGGPGAWTSGHGFKWTSSAGTSIDYIPVSSGVSNLTVSRAKFEQTGNVDTFANHANGIYNTDILDNSTFQYLYFTNIGGLPWLLRNGSGNIFQYNYSGHICGMAFNNPDDHCEGIVIHDMDDVHFRWNFISESPSSGGFVKNNVQTSTDIRIYGNVFGNGFPINCNTGPCQGWRIFNNTFYTTNGGPWGGDGGHTNLLAYNNITFDSTWSPTAQGTHDYNWYSRIDAISCNQNAASHENVNTNYPGDCDNVSTTTDPFVNSAGTTPESFKLSAAITSWPGTSACALDACTGEKKYDLDAFGITRGGDGVWDRGAYEFGTSAGPSAPTNFRLVRLPLNSPF